MDVAFSVALSPDEHFAYVTGALSNSVAVVNITDRVNPHVVGSVFADGTNWTDARGIRVSRDGTRAFVVGESSVVVVDVSVPDKPKAVNSVTSNELSGAYAVAASPDEFFLYVSSAQNDAMVVVGFTY